MNIDIHTELLRFHLLQPPRPPYPSLNPPPFPLLVLAPRTSFCTLLRGWILESSPWKAQTLDHSANIARRTALSVLPTAASSQNSSSSFNIPHCGILPFPLPPSISLPLHNTGLHRIVLFSFTWCGSRGRSCHQSPKKTRSPCEDSPQRFCSSSSCRQRYPLPLDLLLVSSQTPLRPSPAIFDFLLDTYHESQYLSSALFLAPRLLEHPADPGPTFRF